MENEQYLLSVGMKREIKMFEICDLFFLLKLCGLHNATIINIVYSTWLMSINDWNGIEQVDWINWKETSANQQALCWIISFISGVTGSCKNIFLLWNQVVVSKLKSSNLRNIQQL